MFNIGKHITDRDKMITAEMVWILKERGIDINSMTLESIISTAITAAHYKWQEGLKRDNSFLYNMVIANW